MAPVIKKRIIAGETDLNEDLPLSSPPFEKKKNADGMLTAAAVTAKVEDGNIKAIRILHMF